MRRGRSTKIQPLYNEYMDETIGQLGEKRLLQQLRSYLGKSPEVIRTFSEDCAVLELDQERYQLVSVDAMVEGVHFRTEYMPPFYIGRKAIKINVSDISAMGGKPQFYMVSIGAPSDTPARMIQDVYEGMSSAADPLGMVCIGGNLSAAENLFLDIFIAGTVAKDAVIMRSGARVGDSIFVTGKLGSAAEGYHLLKDGFRLLGEHEEGLVIPGDQRDSRFVYECVLRHLDPPCLNDVARAVASTKAVHSMIDLSDGIGSDLAEICRESQVGAMLELSRLPIAPGVLYWERKRNQDPLTLALQGGEDYHLLFTASNKDGEILAGRAEKFKIELFEIGRIVPEDEGIHTVNELGQKQPLAKGYEHFRS